MDALKYSVEVEQPDDKGCYEWMAVRAGQRSCFSGGVDMLGPLNNINNVVEFRVPMPALSGIPAGVNQNVSLAGDPITEPVPLGPVGGAFVSTSNSPSWLFVEPATEYNFWITEPGWYDFKQMVGVLFQSPSVPVTFFGPGQLNKLVDFHVQRITPGYPNNEVGVRDNFYNAYQGTLAIVPDEGGYVITTGVVETIQHSIVDSYQDQIVYNETSQLWPISEGDLEAHGEPVEPGSEIKGIKFQWQLQVRATQNGTFPNSDSLRIANRTNLRITRVMNYVGPEGVE